MGNSMSISADGNTVAAALAGSAQPMELWIGQIATGGERSVRWERRSDVNRHFDAALLPGIETIAWQAADETPVEGLLLRPPGARSGPVPMVVLIHGGPTSSSPYGFRGGGLGSCIPLLAARGIAVLMPNPRGSIGWGLTFAEANHGDMGGEDLADILAGVDYCVREGIADPERLGVGGWSYGGYMTAWAITQTNRFKAAVAGASITNWYSFHGGTNIPAFDEIFYGTNPYALDGPYAARSPIFLVDRVRTPTLFLHGERDACCPVGQAYEMARGLRAYGVETQCAVYPREPHGIREHDHQRDLVERATAWFVDRLV
jgi:dipeptidyl aminopeptidase/acylaminoacyl peptidase